VQHNSRGFGALLDREYCVWLKWCEVAMKTGSLVLEMDAMSD